jgi:hypothetical protein
MDDREKREQMKNIIDEITSRPIVGYHENRIILFSITVIVILIIAIIVF